MTRENPIGAGWVDFQNVNTVVLSLKDKIDKIYVWKLNDSGAPVIYEETWWQAGRLGGGGGGGGAR